MLQSVKRWIKYNFSLLLYKGKRFPACRQKMEQWIEQCQAKNQLPLADASFDIFTYHGEDGIIFYLVKQLKELPSTFIDIGAGDGIKGNCASLVVHFAWQGLFVDQDECMLRIGRRFYRKLGLTGRQNLHFLTTIVTPENVNKIIETAGYKGEIGLLSIDIDGNDYWVWEAIEVIRPVIVVIEAKVEFGKRNIVVPYGPSNHRSVDIQYNGASVEALIRLGNRKGYNLVGSNKYGYNLFFVRKDKCPTSLPSVNSEDVLNHPDTIASFYEDNFYGDREWIS